MAQLHIGLLSKQKNERAIRRALDSLPKKIDDVCNIIMQRIENQDDEDVELAKNVLGWITYAKRPLTTKELQRALATSSDSTDVEECDLTDESILMSVCMGIVIVDPESSVIRLVHYTTQEYLILNVSVRPNSLKHRPTSQRPASLILPSLCLITLALTRNP